MSFQHIGLFQSSKKRYAPLSGFETADTDSGSVTPRHRDSIEKIYRDEPTPILKSRQYLAGFCVFVIGLLIGTALGVIGSTYAKLPREKESAFSGADVKQFAPQLPTTTVIFSKKSALMDPPNEANQRFWDALTPIGHGFVNVSHPEAYGLLPGIPTSSGVDHYAVAMFHQLHCLGLLRHHYWRLIDGMSIAWTSAMRQEEVRKQLRDRHSQHCFAYIAESIMCAGDLTVEWAKVEKDGNRTQVDGWGVPHQCKDPQAIRKWMEANHGPVKDGSVHIQD